MIIPVNIQLPSSTSGTTRTKLPPSLAQLGDENASEIVLIELQGTLEVGGPKDKQTIGTLKLGDDKKPTLMIGHHQLEGKFATLPKPLAILKKQVVKEQADTDMLLDDTFVQKSAPEWDMIAIVKRKIVFAKRPMPIVNSKPVSSVVSSAS